MSGSKGKLKLLPFRQKPDWKRVICFDGCSETLGLPHSQPLPSIGQRCHELRINDERAARRIIYRTDSDAIIILEVFSKKSRATPKAVINACKKRLKDYDNA